MGSPPRKIGRGDCILIPCHVPPLRHRPRLACPRWRTPASGCCGRGQLTEEEFANLRSQNATSSLGRGEVVAFCDHLGRPPPSSPVRWEGGGEKRAGPNERIR